MFDKYLNQVRRFYRTSNKYYHTIHHIEDMFVLFDKYEKVWDSEFHKYNKSVLKWAIAYHDCFYMPGFNKNEHIAALITLFDLPDEVCSAIDGICSAIESTVPSNTDFDNPVDKILHDLDWSGFSNIKTLRENETKIITEAVEVGGIKYSDAVNNQIKFYEAIKNKDLYVTSAFNQFNEVAKNNINTRLNELSIKGI